MFAAMRVGLVRLAVLLGLPAGACAVVPPGPTNNARPEDAGRTAEDTWQSTRMQMVRSQIESRGVTDPRVLEAMRKVPRHRFVLPNMEDAAYEDSPLPIGFGQTISQPYIVAYMSELLQLRPEHRVLEIGTGSGYQAAVLAELVREVFTIEIIPELGERALKTLAVLGYERVRVRIGDGYLGWPDHAPFDRIILTAAPEEVPQPLIDQLAVGGRLVAPVGGIDQWIRVLSRTPERIVEETTIPVRFVPLVRKPRER